MTTTTQNARMTWHDWHNTHKPVGAHSLMAEYWSHIKFVREKIPNILALDFDDYDKIRCATSVIADYVAEAVCMPVFNIVISDVPTKFTLWYNFRNWKVSVDSFREVDVDFVDLFDDNKPVNEPVCEGFPAELIYEPYTKNRSRFTVELTRGTHHIYTFFWIFSRRFLNKR